MRLSTAAALTGLVFLFTSGYITASDPLVGLLGLIVAIGGILLYMSLEEVGK